MLLLQLAVGQPQRAQQFHAAHLKPDQVVGVVHDAHLVGLGIADSYLGGYRHSAFFQKPIHEAFLCLDTHSTECHAVIRALVMAF